MEPGTCQFKVDIAIFDFSKLPYPGTVPTTVVWEVSVECVVMAIIILASIIGNALIIVTVSLSKKMRTTTNIYIMNLAVADLIIACFPTWNILVKEVKQYWATGAFFCKFNSFIQIQSMCALSFTMIVIAGDRFFAVMYPLKARVTHSKVKYVLVIVWTTATAVAVPLLIYYKYWERQWADHVEKVCTVVFPMFVMSNGVCDSGRTSLIIYYVVVLAALIWIPMAAMTASYVTIIHRLQWGRNTGSLGENVSVVQKRSTKKVVKLLFVLLITFIVCTLPYQVTTLFNILKDPITVMPYWYKPVYYTATNLLYAHSCVNPVVYGAMSQQFRTGFLHLVNRFRANRMCSSRKTEMTSDGTTRKNISILNKGDPDSSRSTSLTDLARASSQINMTLAKEANQQ